ncbi:thiaminase II [Tuwongella immobilis]|uniref:Aminopyrimidine aminohydrolase n=1 Tax=Tuwongella immobilis TaxID=692036 RepID=A0A6C2YJZ0_9BACT|nr:thiaminase II [Tuwongella immobilis]VIP01900.1 tena thi-4 family protein : Transcriptional activator, TenA family OS=Conexibacter woesei (strain DSM 14684 / JCM 11494 / NBRC 100937 / ID131577) GN=Cwoe_5519 PE=4 SV=1: TENA_THI-4 [Tuwongella immobilis]VTR99788.1 tena thi-4 family protein : Transcriptional activator, TenA family OS=Conexibacter woesei (strain DSM 14684 / JCM 11494 / NBRC 100937 / ID131577) GN=Cwoe_5519 PE=4 SV=1: TENA_THI-4 [Tuwongella immobilis]
MTERFSQVVRQQADAIWESQHSHPFVRGLGTAELPLPCFQYWLVQDYRFLIDYARLLGLGIARASDLATMTQFAELTRTILSVEMTLHRSYAAQFGISTSQLESTPKSPATQAYTDFLIRTATCADFGELVAALLPCMWGFSEIGQRLAQQPAVPNNPYADWIRTYADPEFAQLAQWCCGLFDRLASEAGESGRLRMAEAFLTSSRLEWWFWDAAWKLETWPI